MLRDTGPLYAPLFRHNLWNFSKNRLYIGVIFKVAKIYRLYHFLGHFVLKYTKKLVKK